MTHEEILIPYALKLHMIRVQQNCEILGFPLYFSPISLIFAVPRRRCPSGLLGNDPAKPQPAAAMHLKIKTAELVKTPGFNRNFLPLPP
jgi:hypothetical protein